jgi:hypothetical protein
LGHIAAVDEGFEDAVDAGFGDTGFLVDILKGNGGVVLFEQLDDIERLGEDRNQVEALDFCLGQRLSPWMHLSVCQIATRINPFRHSCLRRLSSIA